MLKLNFFFYFGCYFSYHSNTNCAENIHPTFNSNNNDDNRERKKNILIELLVFFLVFTTNMKNQTIERKKPTYQKKIQTNR